MSSRGRGRGRGSGGLTFSLESIGFNRGDPLPPPTLQPPPLFPLLETKLVFNHNLSDVETYLVELKTELKDAMSKSCYFINPKRPKPKIERYSDKYEDSLVDSSDNLPIDWKLFPSELQFGKKIKKVKSQKQKSQTNINLDEKFNKLDDVEHEDSDKEEVEKDKDDDNEEEVVEEDIEEGTDYTLAYFDNGESYLEDSDDNLDEGPVY